MKKPRNRKIWDAENRRSNIHKRCRVSLWGTRSIQLCFDTLSAMSPEATRGQRQGAGSNWFWPGVRISAKVADLS